MTSPPRLSSPPDDGGFTLVESMVAIVLAGILFLALAGVLIGALRATTLSRQDQQAMDLTTQGIEAARALDIASLGLDATDAATDPKITAGKYSVKLSDGTASSENVVMVTASPLNPHIKPIVLDNTSYKVATYVTTPPADAAVAGSDYKRVVVDVSWTTRGLAHHRTSSTFVTLVRRGLPQPKFTWAFTGVALADQPAGIPVNKGALLTVSAVLTNRGARDRWNVTTAAKDTSNVVRGWQFAWYNDNGTGAESCNGVRDSDELTRMDPNGDGVADTGTIDTDKQVCLVGIYTIPVTESTSPAVINLDVVATSNAVPTVNSKLTTKVNLGSQTCSGCTYRNYHLQNNPTGVTTPTTGSLPIVSAAPSETTLFGYSTDVDALGGRALQAGGTIAGSDTQSTANWLYSTPTSCSLAAGTAFVNLYAAPGSLSADSPGALTVQLNVEGATAGVFTSWGAPVTFATSNWGFTGYAPVVIPVTVPAKAVAANRRVELRVVAPSSATTGMRLAYGTTSYDAVVQLPVVSGC